MIIRGVGPLPIYRGPDDEGAGGAGNGGDQGDAGKDTQNKDGLGSEAADGSAAFDPAKAYAALDEDTRTWLQTKGFDKDPVVLAKAAREQEKLIGGRVKVPTEKSTPEEVAAYNKAIGVPDTEDGYKFQVPESMPEGLPYDEGRAKVLAKAAKELGLTPKQAQGVLDLYIADATNAFNGAKTAQAEQSTARAKAATDELVKLWGPLDGATARANLEIADKLFTMAPGGQEFLAELKALGIVGEQKEIFSKPLAVFLSGLGTALYTEDGVLRGQADQVGNPFSDGEANNVTAQMAVVKEDPDRARALISAAGKKPEDFGLKAA